MIHAVAWINLENITVSERSQTQRIDHVLYDSIHMNETSRTEKSIKTGSRIVVAWGERGKWGDIQGTEIAQGCWFLFEMMKML